MIQPRANMRRRAGVAIFGTLLLAYVGTGVFHVRKPMPPGFDRAGDFRSAADARLFTDTTYLDDADVQHVQATIFDEVFRLISQAERLVVLDMFLVNTFAGEVDADHRPLSRELVERLVRQRQMHPELTAVLITDPFNTLYGGLESPLFTALEQAGVTVIETDLRPLRDSNPVWSGLWRICCQWFGNRPGGGWLPNLMADEPVTLRSYLALLNFKANHRKTLVVDSGEDWVGLVTSANPHDASSRHGNVAIRFRGPAALDLLATEHAVARMSGHPRAFSLPRASEGRPVGKSDVRLRVLTESRIREAALAMMNEAESGDRLDLAMFYLAHRELVEALIESHRRGVRVRVLLDPNEAAFGLKKSGIPNRQVAMELHRAGVPVRWRKTRGEQAHSKFFMRTTAGEAELLIGSANFTRRNLDNFNPETSVQLRAPMAATVVEEAGEFFTDRWDNRDGRTLSVPYETYADHSRLRYWRYRVMEATGMSSF